MTISQFKPIGTACVLWILASTPARAATIEVAPARTPNVMVPDGSASGLTDTLTITSSNIESITSMTVSVDIEADFAGDLYLYLTHDVGFSTLLNRPGVTGTNPFGYGDGGGFDVTFADDAFNGDAHFYRDVTGALGASKLTGTWQPDGRHVDPLADPRDRFLGSFNGLSPIGDWTLFIADLAGGDLTRLNSWQLTFVEEVPEPGEWMALAVGMVLILGAELRRRMTRPDSLGDVPSGSPDRRGFQG